MRLVQIKPQPAVRTPKRHYRQWLYLMVITISVCGVALYFRPLPPATYDIWLANPPAPKQTALAWPTEGQAGIGANGYDFFASNSKVVTVPTASMAKVITALCVLQKHPLKPSEAGPTITMTAADVARLEEQLEQGGSHLLITEGDTFTEYQMLEAMLLPSANNIADSLAVWAFGSLEAYRSYAQSYLTTKGITHTRIGPDASGFDSSTTSTVQDLTALGKLAQQQPVLMQVAGTKSVTFPTAGKVYNTNTRLGDGILTGLKTGMNEGNSGGFIFTATVTKASHTIPVTGAIVNAGSSARAVEESELLASSMEQNFEAITAATKNQVVGRVNTEWGGTAPITSAGTVQIVRWQANKAWLTHELRKTDATHAGVIGSVSLRSNGAKSSADLTIRTPVSPPSFLWRITHIR